VILEECFSNDVWPGTASLLLPVRKFSPSQLPSNITASFTGQVRTGIASFFTIKPTSCTNFSNLFLAQNSTCFGQFLCLSSGVYSLYIRHWYMSYRIEDSFQAGPG
jgi:hypothetical protein